MYENFLGAKKFDSKKIGSKNISRSKIIFGSKLIFWVTQILLGQQKCWMKKCGFAKKNVVSLGLTFRVGSPSQKKVGLIV